jgi:ribosomal-protein-alanine acetyltransferase
MHLHSRSLRLRPLQPTDLDRVAEIERAVFSDAWSRESLAELVALEHVHAWVLETDPVGTGEAAPAIAGYAVLSLVADEGELLNLAVSPELRGGGGGRALLDEVVRQVRSRGGRRVVLEVRRSNRAALDLYRRAGFRVVGARPGYYRAPTEDALVLCLELAASA